MYTISTNVRVEIALSDGTMCREQGGFDVYPATEEELDDFLLIICTRLIKWLIKDSLSAQETFKMCKYGYV